MGDKKHILEEPAVSYGRKMKIRDIVPVPMENVEEYLRSQGMALGGSLDNAIVVGKEIQASGGLHWENEFVRHKILDLIGDLAALGKPLKAHIIAMKAGHELHLKLTEKLKGVIN